MKQVVILGGGFAGLTIANKLAPKSKKYNFKLTLIEPKTHNLYEPGLLFYAFNKKKFEKLQKPIAKILNKRVEWIQQKAEKIDLENQQILLKSGTKVKYDYLIIATGVNYVEKDFKYSEQPHIHHFYNLEATKKFREMIHNFEGGTIVISPSTVPYKCPPAPVEFAFLLNAYLKKKKIRNKSTIKFLYPLSLPFTMRNVATIVDKKYKKLGIEFVPYCNYETVDTENKKLLTFEGEEIEYDELVLLPIHEGQDIIKETEIGDREGFVKTDKFTMQVEGHENIFAIGDCTNLPTSKAGAVAHYSAPTIAKNVINLIKGKKADAKYNGKTMCFLVTSFSKSMLLDFAYDYPPRKYGLYSNFLFMIFKKLFKKLYFNVLIKGKM